MGFFYCNGDEPVGQLSSCLLTVHAFLNSREQILGLEARAKVPSEFVVQHNKNANPPTLFLPLQLIVKQLIGSNAPRDREYLQHLLPRLQTWFNWFNTSQVSFSPGERAPFLKYLTLI